MLEEAHPGFAWEVMLLEISLEQCSQPSMGEVMRLIQLYMVVLARVRWELRC